MNSRMLISTNYGRSRGRKVGVHAVVRNIGYVVMQIEVDKYRDFMRRGVLFAFAHAIFRTYLLLVGVRF